VSGGVVHRRRVLAAVSRLGRLGDIGVDGHGLEVGGGSLLGDRADCGGDSNGLGGDMGPLGAVSDLRRALGDGVDTGGVDG
jgi:hypothetical protein